MPRILIGYTFVHSDKWNLVRQCNSAVENGYEPFGNLCVNEPIDPFNRDEYMFSQAFVKYVVAASTEEGGIRI